MERLIICDQGISKLDLNADYKGLKLGTYDQPPPNLFILNGNNTMSILKQIKTIDNYEHLWMLSILLDKRLNGRLNAKILNYNLWCRKCRADVRSYSFDMNYKLYKAINTGLSDRCVKCTDEILRFYNHPKFINLYMFTKYGDNYVHQRDFYNNGQITYTILTDNEYTMFKFSTPAIKFHQQIEGKPEEEHGFYQPKIKCTVCGDEEVAYWEHNKTCIKNINKFTRLHSKYMSYFNPL